MTDSEIDVNIFAKDNGYLFVDDPPHKAAYYEVHGTPRSAPASTDRSAIRAGSMNVLAIDTSSRKEKGKTAMLLDPFLEGMKEAGAHVELYYSRDLVIFPCCGNLNCTIKTPGICMAYDDMRWLREKIGQADVLVLASPLYFNGTIGPEGATPSMKSLLGRLVPGIHASSDTPYEHAVHTTRESVNLRKIIFVSGCGFWEIDDFNPVLTHIKALCYNTYPEFACNIVGICGVILRGPLYNGEPLSDAAREAREAGRQLAQDNGKPAECLEAASRERLTRDMYRQIGNE